MGERREGPEQRSDPLADTVDRSGERPRTEPAADSETLDAVGVSVLPPVPDGPIHPRYRTVRELGHGGMGRVLLAEDTRLGRRVALKTRLGDAGSARATLRFVEEACATSQLEHPSIVPVYDLATDQDGRPFFSMRFVEGRSLAQVLDALAAGDEATSRAFGQSELVRVFLEICDAVAYAHHRGVLHRDLKPENVMLGRFGEVFVMDWGLARVGEIPIEAHESGEHRVSSLRESAPDGLTVAGAMLGTPGYMSPEQVRGDASAVDVRSDVWALGAILYEMLTLEPAIASSQLVTMLADTALGRIVPPRRRAPGRRISEGLESIVSRALAVDPAARFQSAKELRDAVAQDLEGALEAARRRAAAEQKLEAARDGLARYEVSRAEHAVLQQSLEEEAAGIGTGVDDLPRRQELWRRQARAAAVLAEARRAYWDAYGALVGAVEDDRDFEPAREALIGLLVGRARELGESGDREGAEDLRAIARQHDAAGVAALLEAPATLELVTDPAGARVVVSRFEEEGPLLVERVQSDGTLTPCALRLAPGSYVCDLASEGRPLVRAPVVLEPGETREWTIRIPAAGEVPRGFAYVPGGRYQMGGDRHAPGYEPRRQVTVQSFAISTRLTTMAEYAEFLSSLAARDPALAAAHAPRIAGRPYWQPEGGRYRVPYTDPDGDLVEPEFPVCMISAVDADAYAAWSGLRLPTSDEWEVAARGADDRTYPWGNGFDPVLCWMRDTQARPHPRPVAMRPMDRSVFGLFDVAGLVSEPTASASAADAFDPTVGSCVAGVFRRLRFPEPEGGSVTFAFPFLFEPAH